MNTCISFSFFFFFNDTATTEIYTLSLHDALPISWRWLCSRVLSFWLNGPGRLARRDRKSTRLNSSHQIISYAVFCLKKKKTLPALILEQADAIQRHIIVKGAMAVSRPKHRTSMQC